MSKELSYLSPEGFTVFTSQFLKNRGTCCKSACLHCPFGYTLKKCGLQFADVSEGDFPEIESIIQEQGPATFEISAFALEHIKWVMLKEQKAGVLFKNHIVIKALFLRLHFQSQGLSKEMVESYYFI